MVKSAETRDVCIVLSRAFLDHAIAESHPENPDRLSLLFSHFPKQTELPFTPPSANLLERIHSPTMIQRQLSQRGKSGWFDPDTYYCPKSVDAALACAGASIELAAYIWNGRFRRGFVLGRPPGHHATRDRMMGFCLLNNIALAAGAVLAEKSDARIAIVDFDLHHGNGTQDIFYDNPGVLFLSSHRYPFYPGTGGLGEVGIGKGKGTTLNFPLSDRFGREVFLPLYARIVSSVLNEFAPEIILVSAGFDGHRRDPMGGFSLDSEDFGCIAEILIASAERRGGKIAFILEGGYNPEALCESVLAVTDRLNRLPRSGFEPKLPEIGGNDRVLESLRLHHQAFFPSLARA